MRRGVGDETRADGTDVAPEFRHDLRIGRSAKEEI